MTWEETIKYIQDKPEFNKLVKYAYLSADLVNNVEAFIVSEECVEILHIIRIFKSKTNLKILDIGAGNGITSLAFALNGFDTTVVEPDNSEIVGCKAIEKLKIYYKLDNLRIIQGVAEKMPFENETFDFVFARQTMHHAQNLNNFVSEAYRVLKQNSCFFTIRDHVVYNDKDKNLFLESHPLQKFYGGENAYTIKEYQNAFFQAGFEIDKVIKHFDSVINYYPITSKEFKEKKLNSEDLIIKSLNKKIGALSNNKFIQNIYKQLLYLKYGNPFKEKNIPGRLYSFVGIKK